VQQISTEEHLPVDYIKQRLAVLEAEIKKVEQDGCQMEDRIRSCACFRMCSYVFNFTDWLVSYWHSTLFQLFLRGFYYLFGVL